SVVKLWTCCDRPLVSFTRAPGTTAPAASDTVPEIWPVTPWPLTIGTVAKRQNNTVTKGSSLFFISLPLETYQLRNRGTILYATTSRVKRYVPAVCASKVAQYYSGAR